MGSFLVASIVASIVLTVLLNVVPRLFPGLTRRAEQRLHDVLVDAEDARRRDTSPRRARVFFPWKGMLIASIVLTIVINLAGLLFS